MSEWRQKKFPLSLGSPESGIRRGSQQKNRRSTANGRSPVTTPPGTRAPPTFHGRVCLGRPAPPAPSLPLSSLLPLFSVTPTPLGPKAQSLGTSRPYPPLSSSPPRGRFRGRPSPAPRPAPPFHAPPFPLTWQRRHQPCWPGRVLRGDRGRGGSGPDCTATAVSAVRVGLIFARPRLQQAQIS